MTFDKFTIKAQEVVQQAVNTAQQNGQQTIEPVHILKGILLKGRDVANFIFQKLGVNAQQIETLADQEIQHLPRVQADSHISLPTPTMCSPNRRALQSRWATSLSAWRRFSWLSFQMEPRQAEY